MSTLFDADAMTSTFVGIGQKDVAPSPGPCPAFQAAQNPQRNAYILLVGADGFTNSDEARERSGEAGPWAWKPVGQLVQGLLERVHKDV